MEKQEMDIREEAINRIKSLQKLEPDFVLSWLGGLTDLEQKIVSNLYQINKAVTIKDIINQIIENSFYATILMKGLSHKDFPFESYYKNSEPRVIALLKSLHPNKGAQISALKKEIKFPSFRRIDKSIQDLINVGIVLAREGKLENNKIKGLYYLNPIIRTQINKLNK